MSRFIYLVTLTDGRSFRVETPGDPTDHPSLIWHRVASVETLGESGKLLSLV